MDSMKKNDSFNIEQAKSYSILKNFQNQLVIITTPYFEPPKNPQIVYDGKEHALLYRDNKNIKILDCIHENIRESLNNINEVIIVELDNNKKIRYEYSCIVNKFSKINLPEEKIITAEQLPEEEKIIFNKPSNSALESNKTLLNDIKTENSNVENIRTLLEN